MIVQVMYDVLRALCIIDNSKTQIKIPMDYEVYYNKIIITSSESLRTHIQAARLRNPSSS